MEGNGVAFGVANDSDITILALLLATNELTGADNDLADNDYSYSYGTNGDGILDADERELRAMANDVYSSINQ